MAEENVNVKDDQTEEALCVQTGPQEGVPENGSTVLGKFKDVDALAKAYESLQAEFTRRSQRLRTLEKEAENFKNLEESSGAEKLRKAAKSRREEAKKFDEFVAEVSCSATEKKPDLQEVPVKSAGAAESEKEGERSDGAFLGAVGVGDAASSAVKREDAPLSLEELYKQATASEEVRLRIVGEYLNSLGKSAAPLTGGGAPLAVTPPARARTVNQAGNMALAYFRKPTID